MRFRLAVAAVACSSFAFAACADSTDPAEPSDSTDDALTVRTTNVTVLQASVREGASVTVPYQPAPYAKSTGAPNAGVPYLAIELEDAPPAVADDAVESVGDALAVADKPLKVDVEGDFPGTPQLLVTNGDFRVLAHSRATVGGQADVTVPVGVGKKFVLVRDKLWTKPMTFTLSVGR
jgi:hypothetical protein